MTKKKVTPDMYALSTLIVVTIFLLLIISNVKNGKKNKRKEAKR
jgi:ABC-type spermidine/putrescine transport system permease subunit II